MNAEQAEIQGRIPHRPPFLFVDRIVDETHDALTAEWEVAHDLPCFAGHYPHHPVLPGVLITELCLQCAALLLSRSGPSQVSAESQPVLTRIGVARFKKIVRPGETLRARVRLVEALGRARYMSARVTSAAELVLDVRFTVALVVHPKITAGVEAS